MAKRRLNTKFIGILAGSILGALALGGGGFYVKHRFFREKPDKFIAAGKDALANHDYVTARDNLVRAIGLSTTDPSLNTMLGDALSGLAYKEQDYVAASRQLWEQAVAADPTYVPALERLVHFWDDELDLCVRPAERTTAAEQLTKAADKLLEVDSKNVVGRRARSQAVIEIMLDGRPTAPSRLNQAEEELLKLQDETPDDAFLPFWVARSRLHQAMQDAHSDDNTAYDSDMHVALSVMLDSVNKQPKNADMAFHTGEIILQMATITQALHKPRQDVAKLLAQAADFADRARVLAQPDDSEYVDINLYDARLVLDRPNWKYTDDSRPQDEPTAMPAIADSPLAQSIEEPPLPRSKAPEYVRKAEEIYHDVLLHRPNEPFTIIALSRLLGDLPSRRQEAIDLLSKPLTNDHPLIGIKGTLLPVLQSEADTRLMSLLLDEVDFSRDPARREALIARCVPLSAKILGKSPDSAVALGLSGRLALVQNHLVEATQSLRQALSLIDQKNLQLERTRNELTFYLARAYEQAQQTGEAETLAKDVAAMYPTYVPAQLMLARLMIAEGNFDGAKSHIDMLAKAATENPQLIPVVLRMRLQCIDPEKDPTGFQQFYGQLPEETREEQLDKARISHGAKREDDALRLLTTIIAKSPADEQAVPLAVSIYAARNQLDLARKLVDTAVVAQPSNLAFVAMKMRFDGKSQDEIDAEMARRGATPSDRLAAFKQEMAEAAVSRQHGDGPAVDRHLAAAQKIMPDDPRLWDAYFTRSLEAARWEQAQTYVEKLATNNVDQAGGALYRIRLAMAQNDTGKAMELAVKLTREKPEFSQSWCVFGDVQRALGKYEEASVSYQSALQRQTQNLDAIRGMIQCDYALDKIDVAKNYIDQARKIDPKNAEFRELELSHELTYGDPQKVIQPRQDALKDTPDDPRAWLALASTYMSAAQARNVAKDSAGALQFEVSAEQTLRDAMSKFPNDQRFPLSFSRVALTANDFPAAEQVIQTFASRPGVSGMPQTAILLGEFYDRAGKKDSAVKVLQDYLANPHTPTDVEADVNVQLRLSSLLAAMGRVDDALASLSSNSNQPEIVRQKIAMLINANRLAEADKNLALESSRGPLPPTLQNLQGELQLAENQPVAARATYDRLLAQHPDDVDGLTQRAQLSLNAAMPNIRAALNDLTHARDLAPRNVAVRLLLANVYKQKGDAIKAGKELESGMRAVPADKKLRLTLVDLYASQQQWNDALRILHDAALIPELASDPDFIHAEAVVAMGRGDYTAADAAINDAMGKSPGNLPMVKTYYDILLHEKASTQLMSHSEELLSSKNNDPTLWWVYGYRARARLIDSPDKAAAADELQRGIALAASNRNDAGTSSLMRDYRILIGPDAAMRVATQNAQQGGHWQLIAADLSDQQDDAAGAIHWYEEALKHFDTLSNIDQTSLLNAAALEYQKLTPPDLVKAADAYRKLVAINPGDVLTLNNLACLLAEPGSPAYEPREALDYAERAYNAMTQSGSDEPQIKDTYGWALIANGKTDEGSSLVQDALTKLDFPEAHYHLAEAMLKRSPPDPDNAAHELTTAMKMLDTSERGGKAVDPALRERVQKELKRARGNGVAG